MRKLRLLASTVLLALCAAMPVMAWADATAQLTAAGLDDGSESFSVAGWNTEQDGKTNLESTVVITLDEGAQSLADAGSLTYSMDVWGSCDECRTMDLTGSVIFYDEKGAELGSWSDSYSEYDTWRQQHSLSGSGIVPAGTVSIEASVKNHVGTSSDLELTGTLAISTAGVDSANGNNVAYNVDSFAGTGTFETGSGQTGHYAMSRTVDATAQGMADLRATMTIFFGADARQSIDDGIAFYEFYASFDDLKGGHGLDGYLSIRFFEASGAEISDARVSLSGSDFGGFFSSVENSRVVLADDDSVDLQIPVGTSYVKLESRATVGTLSDLSSYMRFIFCHEESLRSSELVSASADHPEAADENAVYVECTDEEGEDPTVLNGELTEEELEEVMLLGYANLDVLKPPEVVDSDTKAAIEEAMKELEEVEPTSAFTPAMRLVMTYSMLLVNYPEKLAEINRYDVVSEDVIVGLLYSAKCIGAGEMSTPLQTLGKDQLVKEAHAWADSAGLSDLYESGVDTIDEALGVIKTYVGL